MEAALLTAGSLITVGRYLKDRTPVITMWGAMFCLGTLRGLHPFLVKGQEVSLHCHQQGLLERYHHLHHLENPEKTNKDVMRLHNRRVSAICSKLWGSSRRSTGHQTSALPNREKPTPPKLKQKAPETWSKLPEATEATLWAQQCELRFLWILWMAQRGNSTRIQCFRIQWRKKITIRMTRKSKKISLISRITPFNWTLMELWKLVAEHQNILARLLV